MTSYFIPIENKQRSSMKKILFIIILILLNTPLAHSQEEVVLEFDNTFTKHSLNILEQQNKEITVNADDKIAINETDIEKIQIPTAPEISTPAGENSRFFNSFSNTAKNLYKLQIDNTDVPASLFSEQLTKHVEKGPVDSVHLWTAVQMNSTSNIPEYGDTDTRFNVNLVNVIIDTKMKGGKDNFRLMLDPTHRHSPFLQSFVQDAYYETKRIPHHTLLIGNSRPGVGYEGAQSPYTLPLANRSQISRNFANIRKVGVRLKGNYSLIDYDFGGYSSDTMFTEFMPGVEFDGWVDLKPLGKTDGRYGKLTTGGGIVSGKRNSVDYFVGSACIGYTYKKFWTRIEYAATDGSNGGDGLTKKRRQGWYVTLGYHLTKKLELIARYDEFDPDKTKKNNNQREYTAGMNYYLKGQAFKIFLNYVFCQNEAKKDSHRIIIGSQIIL